MLDSPEAGAPDQAWRAIERHLDEIAAAARSERSAESFYADVLSRLEAMTGLAVTVWRRGPESWHQVADHRDWQPPSKVLSRLNAAAQPTTFATASGEMALVAPIRGGDQVTAAVECRLPEAAASENLGELLAAVCEVASEFENRRLVDEARISGLSWQKLNEFAAAIHADLGLAATCMAIVNEGRRLLGCDRVSILLPKRCRHRLEAVSGLDYFDRRSGEVVHLERLAQLVARTGEAISYSGELDGYPPQLASALSEFADHSTSRSIAVIPLSVEATGGRRAEVPVLVAEHYDGTEFGSSQECLLARLAEHSGSAINNSLRYCREPQFLRAAIVALASRRSILMGLATVLLAALAASLFVIQTDFEVACRGQLRPRLWRDVFAAESGVVAELLVSESGEVELGDPLIRLTNPDFEYEQSRLLGELRTRESELRAVQANLKAGRFAGDNPEQQMRLGADEARLLALSENLREQLALLRRRIRQLTVVSPVAGRVVTDDLKRRLVSRPVERGELLLSVADLEGSWEAEIQIAERDVAQVLAAQAADGELPVRYRLITDPERQFTGVLSVVKPAAETDTQGVTYVAGMVTVEGQGHPAMHSGATVLARVYCGRRSLAFSWFYDSWKTLRTHLMW